MATRMAPATTIPPDGRHQDPRNRRHPHPQHYRPQSQPQLSQHSPSRAQKLHPQHPLSPFRTSQNSQHSNQQSYRTILRDHNDLQIKCKHLQALLSEAHSTISQQGKEISVLRHALSTGQVPRQRVGGSAVGNEDREESYVDERSVDERGGPSRSGMGHGMVGMGGRGIGDEDTFDGSVITTVSTHFGDDNFRANYHIHGNTGPAQNEPPADLFSNLQQALEERDIRIEALTSELAALREESDTYRRLWADLHLQQEKQQQQSPPPHTEAQTQQLQSEPEPLSQSSAEVSSPSPLSNLTDRTTPQPKPDPEPQSPQPRPVNPVEDPILTYYKSLATTLANRIVALESHDTDLETQVRSLQSRIEGYRVLEEDLKALEDMIEECQTCRSQFSVQQILSRAGSGILSRALSAVMTGVSRGTSFVGLDAGGVGRVGGGGKGGISGTDGKAGIGAGKEMNGIDGNAGLDTTRFRSPQTFIPRDNILDGITPPVGVRGVSGVGDDTQQDRLGTAINSNAAANAGNIDAPDTSWARVYPKNDSLASFSSLEISSLDVTSSLERLADGSSVADSDIGIPNASTAAISGAEHAIYDEWGGVRENSGMASITVNMSSRSGLAANDEGLRRSKSGVESCGYSSSSSRRGRKHTEEKEIVRDEGYLNDIAGAMVKKDGDGRFETMEIGNGRGGGLGGQGPSSPFLSQSANKAVTSGGYESNGMAFGASDGQGFPPILNVCEQGRQGRSRSPSTHSPGRSPFPKRKDSGTAFLLDRLTSKHLSSSPSSAPSLQQQGPSSPVQMPTSAPPISATILAPLSQPKQPPQQLMMNSAMLEIPLANETIPNASSASRRKLPVPPPLTIAPPIRNPLPQPILTPPSQNTNTLERPASPYRYNLVDINMDENNAMSIKKIYKSGSKQLVVEGLEVTGVTGRGSTHAKKGEEKGPPTKAITTREGKVLSGVSGLKAHQPLIPNPNVVEPQIRFTPISATLATAGSAHPPVFSATTIIPSATKSDPGPSSTSHIPTPNPQPQNAAPKSSNSISKTNTSAASALAPTPTKSTSTPAPPLTALLTHLQKVERERDMLEEELVSRYAQFREREAALHRKLKGEKRAAAKVGGGLRETKRGGGSVTASSDGGFSGSCPVRKTGWLEESKSDRGSGVGYEMGEKHKRHRKQQTG
ncbi:hypothetical protein HK102_007104 [Quaeritorhiza haematococci]|nr:hypothetical protein HK102_007104 [Quaeritorhiza haematococci]